MRAGLSRAVLARLERHPSGLFTRMELQILLNLTARAFDLPGKRIWHLPVQQALKEYAAFTVQCMDAGDASPRRLYERAFAMGSRIGCITGFTDRADLERLVFFLYRNLQIHMRGSLPGEIRVSECYFSRFYTPRQCQRMSNMDAGMIAGICGGGRLAFTQRLTEGCSVCKACLTEGEGNAQA